MAQERLGSPRARLFVALDLPEEIRDRIVAWQRRQLKDPALRPLRPESLHMTLCFLGYQPEKRIEEIAAAALGSPRPAPELRLLADPVPVPRGKRPRLFALEADAVEAIELQAEVSERLEAARFYKPEKKPFWPHLTVARVKTEKRRTPGGKRSRWGRPVEVSDPPGPIPDTLTEAFRCVRIALYRSHLRPQGAEYESLAELELNPG